MSSISASGLATAAGLQQGDVLLSVNGVAVTGQEALYKQFRSFPDGATVTFSIQW